MGEVGTAESVAHTKRTPIIVEFLVRRHKLGESVPADAQQLLISHLTQLILPIEETYRESWNRDAAKLGHWRDTLLSNLSRKEQTGKNAEKDALRELMKNLHETYGIKIKDSSQIIKVVLRDTLWALSAKFSTTEELEKYLRADKKTRINTGGTKHTRGFGIDTNPPDSSSAWRRE